jgi:hypothetical protein
MVIGFRFCVNMESFNGIKVGPFLVALYYLHDHLHGAKGVCHVVKVSGKTVGVVIVAEGGSVFFVSLGEFSTSLSNIRLVTIGADEFICS